MFKDLRHAVRLLWQSRGWTAVVVLSLALGIGANTAIFSAVNARLLTSLPVLNPEELVRFRYAGRNDMVTSSSGYGFLNKTPDGKDVRATFSYPMYEQFVADNRSMTDLLACAPFGRVNVFVDGQAEIANAFISSGNYYQMLGVAARIGRTILPEDDRPTAPPVAVISSRYWHSRFGTDPAVVGKVIKVNGVQVTIVGVIAPHFSGIQQPVANPPDISVPLALDAQLSTSTATGPPRLSQATYWWLQVMGRLKPGMSAAQAQGNLEGVFQQTARSGLEDYLESLSDEERSRSYNKSRTEVPRLLVEPGGRGFYDISTNEFRSVALLAVVVLLVLLIVCANVANLLLSRATTRRKELSVRLSLGATRGRLVRQLLTESLLLAALGGTLGVVVGYWGKQLLPGAADVPRPFDWRVLTFVFAVSGLTGLVFGILPALRGTGMNVNSALKETSRGVVGSRSWASKSSSRCRSRSPSSCWSVPACSCGRLPTSGMWTSDSTRRTCSSSASARSSIATTRRARWPSIGKCSTGWPPCPGSRRWRCRRRRCSRATSTAPISSCTAGLTRPTSAIATTTSTAWWCRRTSSMSWASRSCPGAVSMIATATRRRRW